HDRTQRCRGYRSRSPSHRVFESYLNWFRSVGRHKNCQRSRRKLTQVPSIFVTFQTTVDILLPVREEEMPGDSAIGVAARANGKSGRTGATLRGPIRSLGN